MRSVLASTLALGILFAGCAGQPAPLSISSPGPTSSAPVPTVDTESGSITGNVTDDEARPIVGATVGLLKNQTTTTTDASGVFTLNHVAPGSQSLFVQALGYQSVAKKVEVKAGEVAKATFVLVSVALTASPYYVPYLRTALIQVDQTWYSTVLADAGQNHSQVCGTCIFTLNIEKGPIQWVTENTYTQTGVVGYNDGVHLNIRTGGAYDNSEFCWHQKREWGNATVSAMAKAGKAQVEVGSSFVGLSFQHRVDMWNTFAYLERLPDEYTALPPTTEKQQDPSVCIFT